MTSSPDQNINTPLNFEQAVQKFHDEYCLPEAPLHPFIFSWGPSHGHESDHGEAPEEPSILIILKAKLTPEVAKLLPRNYHGFPVRLKSQSGDECDYHH